MYTQLLKNNECNKIDLKIFYNDVDERFIKSDVIDDVVLIYFYPNS